MSVVGNLITKNAQRISRVKESGGSLPEGNYIGVITKGALTEAKETKSVFATWSVKVLEGEQKNAPGRVSMNIFKSDGEPNDIGIGQLKSTLTQMFGKDTQGIESGAAWETLMAKSIGYRLKFKVSPQKNSDYMQTRIQAVLGKDPGVKSTAVEVAEEVEEAEEVGVEVVTTPEPPPAPTRKATATRKAPAPKAEVVEEEEDEVEDEPEKSTQQTPEEIQAILDGYDRDELKDFIRENGLKEKIVIKKSYSDDRIRELIMEALTVE